MVYAAAIAGIAALCASAPASAEPEDGAGEADACFTAAERAQPLMKDKRFREARAELEMCSRDVCPRVARTDCRNWLTQVAAAQPSIVIAAHEVNGQGDTRDVVGVRATIDGGITIDRVEAAPVPLDPGRHRVRAEHAGLPPLEQTVEVREGEKNRPVDFTWQTSWVPPEPSAANDRSASRPTPAPAYVLGVAGIVATGAGGYLEASGLSKRSGLQTCKPLCPQGSVDDALNTTRAGDITLGVGLAMLAGAALLYIVRPTESPPRRRADVDLIVGPTPGGWAVGLRGKL